jgi:hypothetical protein
MLILICSYVDVKNLFGVLSEYAQIFYYLKYVTYKPLVVILQYEERMKRFKNNVTLRSL